MEELVINLLADSIISAIILFLYLRQSAEQKTHVEHERTQYNAVFRLVEEQQRWMQEQLTSFIGGQAAQNSNQPVSDLPGPVHNYAQRLWIPAPAEGNSLN